MKTLETKNLFEPTPPPRMSGVNIELAPHSDVNEVSTPPANTGQRKAPNTITDANLASRTLRRPQTVEITDKTPRSDEEITRRDDKLRSELDRKKSGLAFYRASGFHPAVRPDLQYLPDTAYETNRASNKKASAQLGELASRN